MIRLAYIYKDVIKAEECRDEITKKFGLPKRMVWNTNNKTLEYINVKIDFLSGRNVDRLIGHRFYNIYIQPELIEELDMQSLVILYHLKRDQYLFGEFSDMDITRALREKELSTQESKK